MSYLPKYLRGMGLGVFLGGMGAATLLASPPVHAQGRYGGDAVTRQPNGGLEARIETDRTQYASGRAVEITLSLTNVSQYDTSWMTPGRGLPYELSVRDGRSNRTVYTLDPRRGANSNSGLRLAVNETRSWRELWDGRDNDGKRLPSGVYVVEARIAGQRTVLAQIYLGQSGGRPGRPGQGGEDDGWGGGSGGGNNGNGSGNPDRPQWPGRPPVGGGDEGNSADYRSLRPELTSARTVYRPGDTVRLTYRVENRASRVLRLQFSSGQQSDMRATDPNGRQIWQDSAGKSYTQALTEISLRPGADTAFSTSWTIPQNARPGRYEVQAFLVPRQSGGRSGVASTTLSIRVEGNGNYQGREDRPGWNNRRDDYGNDGYGDNDYDNRNNRVPPGVISGGGFGGPTIVYGRRSGAMLVSARVLGGREGTQYVGKKVTVSGRYSCVNPAANNTEWQVGDNGVLLTVVGTRPALKDGAPVTVTGVVRQDAAGRLYLSL